MISDELSKRMVDFIASNSLLFGLSEKGEAILKDFYSEAGGSEDVPRSVSIALGLVLEDSEADFSEDPMLSLSWIDANVFLSASELEIESFSSDSDSFFELMIEGSGWEFIDFKRLDKGGSFNLMISIRNNEEFLGSSERILRKLVMDFFKLEMESISGYIDREFEIEISSTYDDIVTL